MKLAGLLSSPDLPDIAFTIDAVGRCIFTIAGEAFLTITSENAGWQNSTHTRICVALEELDQALRSAARIGLGMEQGPSLPLTTGFDV